MPLNPNTEKLLEILGSEVRDFVRAELAQSRIQMRAELAAEYGKRLASLEKALGLEVK